MSLNIIKANFNKHYLSLSYYVEFNIHYKILSNNSQIKMRFYRFYCVEHLFLNHLFNIKRNKKIQFRIYFMNVISISNNLVLKKILNYIILKLHFKII